MSQSESKDPHHPHDKFFKAVFKQPEHVREILEAVAPEAVLSALRLDTLRLSDASFVDEQLAEHFADIVLHCDTADSNPSAYISMLLEHKSYVPAFVPLQLMRYQQNGWTQQVRQPTPMPVPILPVLFYHGEETWPMKFWPEYLHGWNNAFEPYTPRGGYILVDLSALSDERITRFRSGVLTTALLLMKHRKEREFLLDNLVFIFNFVVAENVEESARVEHLKLALRYLRSLKTIRQNEIKSKLQSLMAANQVWDVLAEERAEGFEEGMEKGMEKGSELEARAIIASLIRHMPEADDETIANLSSKPVELVAQVRRDLEAGKA